MKMFVFSYNRATDGYDNENDVVAVGQKTLDLANLAKGRRIDTLSPIYKKMAGEISETAHRALEEQGGYMDGKESSMLSAALALLRSFETGDEAEISQMTQEFYDAAHRASELEEI